MRRALTNDVPPETLQARDDEREEDVALEGASDVSLDFDATPESVKAGMEVVRAFWTTLPHSPGVYRMIDRAGEVLYVGKAKSLKNRVSAYIRGQGHTNRIARAIAETVSMEFVTTANEAEALLLEANLIKQLKPRYNVTLRDDKSLPYILVADHPEAPQILKHRGARSRPGRYYGPFASAGAVNRTINALQRAFLLRSCNDSFYENRTRPCLLFQIKRCSGPCTGEITPADYAGLAEAANDFLAGRSSAVKERLAQEMQAASDALEFERAARYRDRISALSAIQGAQSINLQDVEEADVIALAEQAGQFCVEVFFFRNRQNWGNRAYFPRADKTTSPEEVLASFVAQFYDDKPAPRLVLLSHEIEDMELMAAALATRVDARVEIHAPKRGERRMAVEQALRNAREALARRLAETSSQAKLLAALGQAFGMAKAPRRVEVYDNSHIMGTNAVGAMIVAGPDGFMRTNYRNFTIRSDELTPGDDFAMMREVLTRRFARLMKEHPRAPMEDATVSSPPCGEGLGVGGVGQGQGSSDDSPPCRQSGIDVAHSSEPPPPPAPPHKGEGSALHGESASHEGSALPLEEMQQIDAADRAFPAWPDLVLIDGGKGQLEAVRKVFEDLGVTGVTLVSIAKGRDRDAGRETFFAPGRPAFRLPPRDPALYFVQRLRDEAHRFAIGAHRAKRKREMVRSPLDEIAGIGPTRKRALLHHFGSVKAIERAALEDLRKAPGVNAATAKAVYEFFHQGR